jgi:hypothetical protein
MLRMQRRSQWFFADRLKYVYTRLTRFLNTKADLGRSQDHISAPFECDIADIFFEHDGDQMRFTSTMRYLLVDSMLRRVQLFEIYEDEMNNTIEIFNGATVDNEPDPNSKHEILNHIKQRNKISVGNYCFKS